MIIKDDRFIFRWSLDVLKLWLVRQHFVSKAYTGGDAASSWGDVAVAMMLCSFIVGKLLHKCRYYSLEILCCVSCGAAWGVVTGVVKW